MSWLVVFTVGVILQTISTAIPLFVAGRCIAGLGVGGISALIPLYQSETSPKWIRGTIVGAYQLAITIGLLLASIVGNSTKNRDDTGSYRIPIAVQFAWAIILFSGLLILPETPRYYIKQNKHEKAAKSLSRLRRLDVDHPAIAEELAEIVANHEYEMSLGRSSYIDCFKGNLGKRLGTGCGLQALQQLTGVNFIFYYGASFFQGSGIGNGFTISLITSCINVASTFPGLYLVEKWGRRRLLLFGAAGMAICQFIVAGVGTLPVDNRSAQQALVAFVCIYIFFFACSWGPCAWVVTGEMFPLKVRAKSLSMTTASNWLLNWAIGYATPYMVSAIHTNVFWVWAGFCFICFFFVWALSKYPIILVLFSNADFKQSTKPRAFLSSRSTSCTPNAPRHGSRRALFPLSLSRKCRTSTKEVPHATSHSQTLRPRLSARRASPTRRASWARRSKLLYDFGNFSTRRSIFFVYCLL